MSRRWFCIPGILWDCSLRPREAPRVVVTNGMVIPNYSSRDDWERLNALGVSQYGQMTAGSFMYIGPQGIVHGTTHYHHERRQEIQKSHPRIFALCVKRFGRHVGSSAQSSTDCRCGGCGWQK